MYECIVHLLEDLKSSHAPQTPAEPLGECFVESCYKLNYVEYLKDLILMRDITVMYQKFVKS